MPNTQSSGMTPKNKAIAIATVLVFLIVGWQALSLFRSDAPVEPTPPQSADHSAQPTAGATNSTGPSTGSPTGQPAGMAATSVEASLQSQQELALNKSNQELFDRQQKETEKYLEMVNKLQNLRLEKEIAETTKDIASANLNRAEYDKKMNDFQMTPQLTTAKEYANRFVPPPPPVAEEIKSQPVKDSTAPPNLPQPAVLFKPNIDYVLVSISMQLDKWTAVLGYDNKLYRVTVGDTLPADGSMVVAIDNHSIQLKNKVNTRTIDYISSE